MQKLFINFDIESDGPSPAENSMLSIGMIGNTIDGVEVFRYQANITKIEGKKQNIDTMKFWSQYLDVYKFITTDTLSPEKVMKDISEIILKYNEYKLIWVADPAVFDWSFLKYYYEKYKMVGAPNIGYSARCLGTLFEAYCDINNISETDADILYDDWKDGCKATHNPLDDSICQKNVFFNLRRMMKITC